MLLNIQNFHPMTSSACSTLELQCVRRIEPKNSEDAVKWNFRVQWDFRIPLTSEGCTWQIMHCSELAFH